MQQLLRLVPKFDGSVVGGHQRAEETGLQFDGG
jgi:hypothetical protein